MRPKFKFSLADNEKIIHFVKNHEILYNVQHRNFRDAEAKRRLWKKLAKELNTDADVVKKKWMTMRDYFIRNQQKKSTDKAVTRGNRDELLMFLLNIPIRKRRTVINMPSTGASSSQIDTSNNDTVSEDAELKPNIPDSQLTQFQSTDDSLNHELHENATNTSAMTTASGTLISHPSASMGSILADCASAMELDNPNRTAQKRAPPRDAVEVLCDYLAKKKTLIPLDYLPQPMPKDSLDKFLESIGSTLRSFPSLSIAKVKLKISQLVGEEEVALAQKDAQAGAVDVQNVPLQQTIRIDRVFVPSSTDPNLVLASTDPNLVLPSTDLNEIKFAHPLL